MKKLLVLLLALSLALTGAALAEAAPAYAPADFIEAPPEAFSGEWTAEFADASDLIQTAEALGVDLTARVEGLEVRLDSQALGFSDQAYNCAYADGALAAYADGELLFDLVMMVDGRMRLFLSPTDPEDTFGLELYMLKVN